MCAGRGIVCQGYHRVTIAVSYAQDSNQQHRKVFHKALQVVSSALREKLNGVTVLLQVQIFVRKVRNKAAGTIGECWC